MIMNMDMEKLSSHMPSTFFPAAPRTKNDYLSLIQTKPPLPIPMTNMDLKY